MRIFFLKIKRSISESSKQLLKISFGADGAEFLSINRDSLYVLAVFSLTLEYFGVLFKIKIQISKKINVFV